MARFSATKREVLDSIADEFLHNYAKGRTLIAVEGAQGAASSTFADALSVRLARGGHSVFRASVGSFHKPRAQRYARGADSAEGYYRDSFDYELLRRVLVEPFTLGGSAGFVRAAYDVARDIPVTMAWQTGPQDATLVMDGQFLSRPELRGLWNFSVWLDGEVEVADDPRIPGAFALYVADADPRNRATAIVDNSDPEHPRRLLADSC